MSMQPESDSGVTTCGNCRAPMPQELRFCRNCGFRLGEGLAEYTETVRFQNAPPGTLPGNNSANSGPYGFGGPLAASPRGKIGKRRRRLSGMTWMFIGLLIFFLTAGVFTAIIKPIRDNVHVQIAQSIPHSYAGVTPFDTTEGGVTFDNISCPGGPADKAGLVGGDVITTVDGRQVRSDDEMTDLMRALPIGKTVDIVYLRDGETKNTKLTTISEDEMDRLNEVFADRPQGRGQFGYEDDEAERVPIPNTPLFGVQLGEVLANRPADIAGIKAGDIVIQFGDTPIRTPEEFLSRVRRAVPYSTVTVVVMRAGERLEIPVKMGKG